jgi:proline iminopeptidase
MAKSRVEKQVLEERVTIGGATLYTWTQGEGVPLVLLHGGPGGYDELEPVAGMIDDLARVHRFDQRAAGRSTGGPPFTVDRWLQDLEGLRAHWGHERWVVAGHSFGAAIALAYAMAHPERTLALVYMSCLPAGDPAAHEAYRANRLARIPEARRERWAELRRRRQEGAGDPRVSDELLAIGLRAEFADPVLAERCVPRMLADERKVNWEVNEKLGADFELHCEDPEFLVRVQAFDRPALIMHGQQDLRPTWAVEALARKLPDAVCVELPGGHFPWLEAPEPLRLTLREFLSGILAVGDKGGERS